MNTESNPSEKSFTRFFPCIARVLLGLMFCFSGLNGFFHFADPKEPPVGAVAAFMGGMMATGYMFPLLFGTQLAVGVLFLVNRFVPLALAVLAPIMINIFLFHAFVAPAGLVMAIILSALHVYLAWSYRAAFRPMLGARVTPSC